MLLSSLLPYSGLDSGGEEETVAVTAIKKFTVDFVLVLVPVSKEQVK